MRLACGGMVSTGWRFRVRGAREDLSDNEDDSGAPRKRGECHRDSWQQKCLVFDGIFNARWGSDGNAMWGDRSGGFALSIE
jgi:hypothetical protein